MSTTDVVRYAADYAKENSIKKVLSMVLGDLWQLPYLPQNPFSFLSSRLQDIEAGIDVGNHAVCVKQDLGKQELSGIPLHRLPGHNVWGLPHLLPWLASGPALSQGLLLLRDELPPFLLQPTTSTGGGYKLSKYCALLGPCALLGGLCRHAPEIELSHDYGVEGPRFEQAVTAFTTALRRLALAIEASPLCLLGALEVLGPTEEGSGAGEECLDRWDLARLQSEPREFINTMNDAATKRRRIVVHMHVYVCAAPPPPAAEPREPRTGSASSERAPDAGSRKSIRKLIGLDDDDDDDDDEDEDEGDDDDDDDEDDGGKTAANLKKDVEDDGLLRRVLPCHLECNFHFRKTGEKAHRNLAARPLRALMEGVFFDHAAAEACYQLYQADGSGRRRIEELQAAFAAEEAAKLVQSHRRGEVWETFYHAALLCMLEPSKGAGGPAEAIVNLGRLDCSLAGYWHALSRRFQAYHVALQAFLLRYPSSKFQAGNLQRIAQGLAAEAKTALDRNNQSQYGSVALLIGRLLQRLLDPRSGRAVLDRSVLQTADDLRVCSRALYLGTAFHVASVHPEAGKMAAHASKAAGLSAEPFSAALSPDVPLVPVALALRKAKDSKKYPAGIAGHAAWLLYTVDTRLDEFLASTLHELFEGNKEVGRATGGGFSPFPYSYFANNCKVYQVRFENWKSSNEAIGGLVRRPTTLMAPPPAEVHRVRTRIVGADGNKEAEFFGSYCALSVLDPAALQAMLSSVPGLDHRQLPASEDGKGMQEVTALGGQARLLGSFVQQLTRIVIQKFFFCSGVSFDQVLAAYAEQVVDYVDWLRRSTPHVLVGLCEDSGEGPKLLWAATHLPPSKAALARLVLARLAASAKRGLAVVIKAFFASGAGSQAMYIEGRVNMLLYFTDARTGVVRACLPPRLAAPLLFESVFLSSKDAYAWLRLHPPAPRPGGSSLHPDRPGLPGYRGYSALLKAEAAQAGLQGDYRQAYITMLKYWMIREDAEEIADVWRMCSSVAGTLHGLLTSCHGLTAVLREWLEAGNTRLDSLRVLQQLATLRDDLCRSYILNEQVVFMLGLKREVSCLLKACMRHAGAAGASGPQASLHADVLVLVEDIAARIKVVMISASYYLHACCPRVRQELDSMIRQQQVLKKVTLASMAANKLNKLGRK